MPAPSECWIVQIWPGPSRRKRIGECNRSTDSDWLSLSRWTLTHSVDPRRRLYQYLDFAAEDQRRSHVVLVADLNVFSYSFQRILAPHTPRGPSIKAEAYFEAHPEAYQQTPRSIGAQGGNVGLLDGSVAWKDVKRMRDYRTSQIWAEDGSFGLW